jgi:hypothetical protein
MLRFFAALLPLQNTTTAVYGAGEAKYISATRDRDRAAEID